MVIRSVNVRIDTRGLRRVTRELDGALRRGVEDCIDDLVRTSSESAPHDKGILERSYSKEVTVGARGKVDATVEYAVRESYSGGNFNYAIKMHEGSYNLGLGSQAKNAEGGGVGMSGRTYPVGPKFLTRPLEGEADKYQEHIKNELERELR